MFSSAATEGEVGFAFTSPREGELTVTLTVQGMTEITVSVTALKGPAPKPQTVNSISQWNGRHSSYLLIQLHWWKPKLDFSNVLWQALRNLCHCGFLVKTHQAEFWGLLPFSYPHTVQDTGTTPPQTRLDVFWPETVSAENNWETVPPFWTCSGNKAQIWSIVHVQESNLDVAGPPQTISYQSGLATVSELSIRFKKPSDSTAIIRGVRIELCFTAGIFCQQQKTFSVAVVKERQVLYQFFCIVFPTQCKDHLLFNLHFCLFFFVSFIKCRQHLSLHWQKGKQLCPLVRKKNWQLTK